MNRSDAVTNVYTLVNVTSLTALKKHLTVQKTGCLVWVPQNVVPGLKVFAVETRFPDPEITIHSISNQN